MHQPVLMGESPFVLRQLQTLAKRHITFHLEKADSASRWLMLVSHFHNQSHGAMIRV